MTIAPLFVIAKTGIVINLSAGQQRYKLLHIVQQNSRTQEEWIDTASDEAESPDYNTEWKKPDELIKEHILYDFLCTKSKKTKPQEQKTDHWRKGRREGS